MQKPEQKTEGRISVNEDSLKYIGDLLDITTRMLSAFNLDKLLKQILDTSIEFLKADTGSLMLLDEDARTLRIKTARGLSKELAEKTSINVGEKIAGWVAREGRPLLLIGSLKDDPRFKHLDEKKEITSAVSVPLKVEERVIGVLNINNVKSDMSFSESDMKLISLLANQAAISIWNVKLYEDAKAANRSLMAAQQQLIAQEKMAALGQLSTGIAHEINNPLTVLTGNVQYLMSTMPESGYGREELQEIKEAADLCSRIIQRLFDYCRPSDYKVEPVNLNDIAVKAVELIEHQFERQRIKINLDLSAGLPAIMVNPDEMKEIFLNITLNAKSAMPKGGTLTISTKAADSGKAVEIRIADTGCGVPDKIKDKIFDPFFTTKRPGSAGLGLSICQRIVRGYNGSIEIQSEEGKGSVFIIRIQGAVSR